MPTYHNINVVNWWALLNNELDKLGWPDALRWEKLETGNHRAPHNNDVKEVKS